jgi:hypothetical protein
MCLALHLLVGQMSQFHFLGYPHLHFLFFFLDINNRSLEFNDTGFFCHLSVYKRGVEWLQGKWTGGGHLFFAKYNFNLSYIFLYIFCQKWLDPLHYLLPIQNAFFFKTFFTVSKPKATNSRVSDCYLTQNQQFSAISWREQVNFQWHDSI